MSVNTTWQILYLHRSRNNHTALTTTSQILLDKNFTLFSWWNLSFPFCVQLIYKNFMVKSFFFFPRPTYTKRSTRNEHWRLILEFVTLKIFIYMHVEIYKIQLIWIFLVFICKPVFIFFVFYCVYVCFTQIIRHCSKIPFITCPPIVDCFLNSYRGNLSDGWKFTEL